MTRRNIFKAQADYLRGLYGRIPEDKKFRTELILIDVLAGTAFIALILAILYL